MNREFSQDAENLIPDFRPSVFTDKVVISTYNYKHETNWSHRSRGLPTLIKHRTPTSPSPTAHNPPPHTTQHSQQPPPQQKQHHNNNKPNGNVVRVHVLMHAVLLQPLVHLPLILKLVTVFPWKFELRGYREEWLVEVSHKDTDCFGWWFRVVEVVVQTDEFLRLFTDTIELVEHVCCVVVNHLEDNVLFAWKVS